MTLQIMLTISAIYLGALGLGFMFAPEQVGVGAVPPDASPALIAYLRISGGPMVGIAVLNWLSRKLGPSPARDVIVLANILGFACVTSMDIWGVFTGASRPIAKLFLVIHFLMTVGFIMTRRK